ncbi:hypothetical protein SAMN02745221_02081 [Thermosyntropha lipolytica DSM 11003]|uniref:Uncharacterized protein n=1 Tax=Thermosyntropha lipolytica DSM 11003 TaxID=1123382 RepID=A0A1M5RQ17_9FIRM|nr:hypothetical protein SAMN02745221_02081 [Thermosyntropha lipolytica DSM 11003]
MPNIKLNLEEIEAMLYFWTATVEREKVHETYLNEIASMPGLSACYDEEFNAESVRKVLSAITNRELLSQKTKKEGRFWNNNMWMTEDLEYTNMMIKPLKKLNLDDLEAELIPYMSSCPYENIEVIFSPLHFDEYIIKDNKLVINFFRVKPDDREEGKAAIEGKEIKEYIKEKLLKLLNK